MRRVGLSASAELLVAIYWYQLRSKAAPILWSLCHDGVGVYVGVCLSVYYVSMIKRKPLIGMTW